MKSLAILMASVQTDAGSLLVIRRAGLYLACRTCMVHCWPTLKLARMLSLMHE